MTRVPIAILAGLMLGAAIPHPLATAGEKRSGTLPLEVDAASFPDSAGASVTYLLLSLVLSPHQDPGRFLVRVEVKPRKGETRIHERVYDDVHGVLRGRVRWFELEFPWALSPGKARARVRVTDLDRDLFAEREWDFEVPDVDPRLALSDPLFGICPADSEAAVDSGPFGKGFEPRASRLFGPGESPCFLLRLQDAGGDPGAGSHYGLEYAIKNDRGREVQKGTLSVPRRNGSGEVRVPLDTRALGTGEYVLRLEARFGGKEISRERVFTFLGGRERGIEDPHMIRGLLGYVATNRELRELDEAPDDSLQVLWDRIWQRRDPDPRTPANEGEAEFLRRVDYANRHFGSMEPGWESDRGRIFIQFGVPDRIEEIPGGGARLPTWIWTYESRNRTYVFQDAEGFGRFRLAGGDR